MEVISFTGRSGTGKSYKANTVALENKCDAIIDDGLLIYRGQIVAGSSAKKCESKAAAMRTALFDLEENRKAVQSGLVKYRPEKLLVLGTSDRMADWICDALGISRASTRIHIQDVSTEDEMQLASESRVRGGEHVIPAPIVQLKRDFAGYFINPMRLYNATMDNNGKITLKSVAAAGQAALGGVAHVAQAGFGGMAHAAQAALGFGGNNAAGEIGANDVTIVRPKFSSIGDFKMSDRVIRDIVAIVTRRHENLMVLIKQLRQGKVSGLTIHLELCIVDSAESVPDCIALQEEIVHAIESMTSFNVNHVNIRISDIIALDGYCEYN